MNIGDGNGFGDSVQMKCKVYKGSKRQDHYLYVPFDEDLKRVPAALVGLLGGVELVMELELSAGRRLAQADARDVMRSLKQSGYYLQLPPGERMQ